MQVLCEYLCCSLQPISPQAIKPPLSTQDCPQLFPQVHLPCIPGCSCQGSCSDPHRGSKVIAVNQTVISGLLAFLLQEDFTHLRGTKVNIITFLAFYGWENYVYRNRPMVAKDVFPKKPNRV